MAIELRDHMTISPIHSVNLVVESRLKRLKTTLLVEVRLLFIACPWALTRPISYRTVDLKQLLYII